MYDFQWVLFNTNVKHELQNSAYQERVQETQKALKIIQSVHPQVKSLAQVSMEILVDLKNQFSTKIYNRVLYVVQEQKRVEDAVLEIGAGNWSELGKLLNDTHEGLKNLYEVSCQELDYLVELTQPIKEVYGARMMGGGFGGCTLNLVKKEAVENVVMQVLDAYNTKFKVPCTPIILQ
jgi:galactokinase